MENITRSAYYKIAQQALMNWNGLSESEASKIIQDLTFEEIENQIYAKSSINYTIDSIQKSLGIMSDENKEEMANFIYDGKESKVVEILIGINKSMQMSEEGESILNNQIMNALFDVHDGWVKDNPKKFMARDKKYQHMPSELIGWNEVKSDLLFVKPIYESIGVYIDEEKLEKLYNERVKEFFLDKNVVTSKSLSELITKGPKFYSPLADYGEVLEKINAPEYVEENVIPSIEEKGIGKVEDVRKNIVSNIIRDPEDRDIDRLTENEKFMAEELLNQEVTLLSDKKDELQEKKFIIERIRALAKRRNDIKKEINIEKDNKEPNSQDLDN